MTLNDVIYDLRIAENLARKCNECQDMNDINLEEIAETIGNCIYNLEVIIEDIEYIQGGIDELI